MPKETFLNLREDKKRKIFDAAVKEFAENRFSEASINQIIKTSSISRGSFYQYFNDKEDLFLYVLTEISKERQEIERLFEPLPSEADVFEEFMHKTRISQAFNKPKPEYYRIAAQMEKDESPFIKNLKELSNADRARVMELFERDKRRGLIKPEVDASIVMDLITMLSMAEFFQSGLEDERFITRLEKIIEVIKHGVSKD